MVARTRIPPPPVSSADKTIWNNWYVAVKDAINNLRNDLQWVNLNFTGSNLTDIETRNHNDLENVNGGTATEQYHFTSAQHTDLTDAGESTLHYHASDRDSANFTGTNWTDLTDGGSTTLHHHGGLSVTITTAKLNAIGANGSMTFTNGILTAQTQAT